MELKEARKMAKAIRDASPPRAYKTGIAIMTLDDRITELEIVIKTFEIGRSDC